MVRLIRKATSLSIVYIITVQNGHRVQKVYYKVDNISFRVILLCSVLHDLNSTEELKELYKVMCLITLQRKLLCSIKDTTIEKNHKEKLASILCKDESKD